MAISVQAKSILNKTKRRDPWFLDDYTLNPYSGCSFNCLFCYIRGSKYGIHMDRKMGVKTNAPELLDKQLANRAKKGQYGIIVMSSATDPYLQLEERTQLTRQLLEIILRHRFPVHIITRSDLVIRDLDLLEEINQVANLPSDIKHLSGKAIVTFSFSCLDEKLASQFEPGATSPSLRLESLNKVSSAGFLTGVSMMPILPYLSDSIEAMGEMIGQFKRHGAQYVMPASLTLFGKSSADSKQLVLRAISKYYPELIEKYESLYAYGYRPPDQYRNKIEQAARKLVTEAGLRTGLQD